MTRAEVVQGTSSGMNAARQDAYVYSTRPRLDDGHSAPSSSLEWPSKSSPPLIRIASHSLLLLFLNLAFTVTTYRHCIDRSSYHILSLLK